MDLDAGQGEGAIAEVGEALEDVLEGGLPVAVEGQSEEGVADVDGGPSSRRRAGRAPPVGSRSRRTAEPPSRATESTPVLPARILMRTT